MQALVESGQAMAAILEDDVTLLPDFPRVLDALPNAAALPSDISAFSDPLGIVSGAVTDAKHRPGLSTRFTSIPQNFSRGIAISNV